MRPERRLLRECADGNYRLGFNFKEMNQNFDTPTTKSDPPNLILNSFTTTETESAKRRKYLLDKKHALIDNINKELDDKLEPEILELENTYQLSLKPSVIDSVEQVPASSIYTLYLAGCKKDIPIMWKLSLGSRECQYGNGCSISGRSHMIGVSASQAQLSHNRYIFLAACKV